MLDFIHIGLPKAGSTFLQSALFRNHPQLQVFGCGSKYTELDALSLQLYLYRGPDEDEWRRAYRNLTDKYWDSTSKKGMSHEFLSGLLYEVENRAVIARRLARLFPGAKIIIVLRHPFHIIRSYYTQRVKANGITLSYQEFLTDKVTLEKLSRFLNYRDLIDLYADLFGSERVLILPFELLVQDNEQFVADITQFIGIDYVAPMSLVTGARFNTSLSLPSVEIVRRTNRIFQARALGKVRRGIAKSLSLAERWISLPAVPTPTRHDLHHHAQLSQLLHTSNYAFWAHELARFNYTFE